MFHATWWKTNKKLQLCTPTVFNILLPIFLLRISVCTNNVSCFLLFVYEHMHVLLLNRVDAPNIYHAAILNCLVVHERSKHRASAMKKTCTCFLLAVRIHLLSIITSLKHQVSKFTFDLFYCLNK